MLGKYDIDNPAALKRLIAGGTQLRYWSRPIMEACFKASRELYAEESARNPKFKKIFDQWTPFLATEDEWFRVEEQQFDNFMYAKVGASLTGGAQEREKPRGNAGLFLRAGPARIT